MPSPPGKMFLAEQRGLLETDRFRRLSAFNFGAYYDEHKTSFGHLHGLNEETLAGGHQVEVSAALASYVLIIPITGAVEVLTASGSVESVDVGEMLVCPVAAGRVIGFTNPYPEELVNFLHLWVASPALVGKAGPHPFKFDEATIANRLAPIIAPTCAAPALPFALSLGRFAGRTEVVYEVQQPGTGLFAFVIAGAFEIEGRLLHAHDGLALWDVAAAEFEALSNDALVLVLELAP